MRRTERGTKDGGGGLQAGEYMRPSLEKLEQFLKESAVDLDACSKIENNYDADYPSKRFGRDLKIYILTVTVMLFIRKQYSIQTANKNAG